jgi:hypothetical protein
MGYPPCQRWRLSTRESKRTANEAARTTELASSFLDARASAVVAREVARDVLRHLQAGSTDCTVTEPPSPASCSGTIPAHPLDSAVRDLVLTTLAASHAAEAASRAGNADDARAAGEAARLG